jgi:molybdopterin molybdotransferase
MDGYAVRAADVRQASPRRPVALRLAGKIPAGQRVLPPLSAGECVRLFTGSPLPPGADAVVMQEATRPHPESNGKILILAPVDSAENVRRAGEDVRQGATVLEAGCEIRPGHLALLAALGLPRVAVRRQPQVALLAAGSELRRAGQTLHPGEIYESSLVAMAEMVRRAGGLPQILPVVSDSLRRVRHSLGEALASADVVVSSGGVSVGEYDFVRQAFAELGGRLGFWRVAIKPGQPLAFGTYQEKVFLGLPGNPVSSLVTFHLLVRPVLRWMQGAEKAPWVRVPARLAEPLSNESQRRHFVRVQFDSQGRVRSAGLQASHALSSLALADGLVDVPPGTVLRSGRTVSVILW